MAIMPQRLLPTVPQIQLRITPMTKKTKERKRAAKAAKKATKKTAKKAKKDDTQNDMQVDESGVPLKVPFST